MAEQDDRSFETMHLQNQLGITAQVQRSADSSELMRRANSAVRDIGAFIQKDALAETLKESVYCGSFASHIYMFPALGQVVFISQTDCLGETGEQAASDAFQELKREALRQLEGDLMTKFGRQRRRRRSGL